MFKNYFKIAFRNLWKHRVFSSINILGLTVGMTACFLIFLYVRFELSYDGFHSKADRIFRVICDVKTPTDVIRANGPSWAIPANLKNEFPEVESEVRVVTSSLLFRMGDTKFQEMNSLFADSTFFQVFDFKLIEGNPRTVLRDPFSVVFTKTAAKKYFGSTNPVGQTMLLTGKGFRVKVTGLMEDFPENSQIKADLLVSMNTETQHLNQGLEDIWQWSDYHPLAYLLLKPNTSAHALQGKFPKFLESRYGSEMRKQQMFTSLYLEPLKDVYLHSTRDGFKMGNIKNVYIFSVIATVILLIACINFVNLTTARSTERAKEVGIRKVIGALQIQLARQFIGESILLCSIAFLLTIVLSALLFPEFNQLSGKIISHSIFDHTSYILLLFCAAIGIGFLAGIYPAFVLSSFNPSAVLKGRFATGTRGNFLRKGLVLIQFSLSIGFIIATIIVYHQLNYMLDQDLGFSKDQILVIDTEGDPGRTAFQQSLKGLPGVQSTAQSSSVPGYENLNAYSEIENYKGEMQITNMDLYFVDWDYLNQFKIKVIRGRGFSREFQSDTTQSMVINEAAVKMLGYHSSEQAIGKRFSQYGRDGKIIGVMKDFHYHSLQQEIKPLSMRIEPDGCFLVSVNVYAAHLSATISAIENKWKNLIPHRPFIYFFLDEFFDQQYRSEERFGKLFLNFAILAIFISCMGLFGLASYNTMQRTKEIGIRKVMGASVFSIVYLLSKDFLKLVLISFFVAAPLSGLFMNQWLHDFAYRIEMKWWVFLLAGVLALLVALITIGFQANKAASTNPIKSLKVD
jgi:putative ABC transport system permease protein